MLHALNYVMNIRTIRKALESFVYGVVIERKLK